MTIDVESALNDLLPPPRFDFEKDEIPIEQDMRRNPHGLGRGWTDEQRGIVRWHALRESIYSGVSLVPKDRRDDDTIMGRIVQVVLAAAQDEETPIDQLETALEALWIRVIHAHFGDSDQARLWCAHAAGLLGEIT